jgi:NADH-quinone oxidoreductase subunit J
VETLLFIVIAVAAVATALVVMLHKNPVIGGLFLVGNLLCIAILYLLLHAQFLAAIQVIVYAGAIMVLVVFVIMLLNVEQEERGRARLKFLVPTAVVLSAVLIAEVAFILVSVQEFRVNPTSAPSDVGLTHSIGAQLFTRYLLPFEITSILLLMAIVGAMTLARRGGLLPPNARVVPGAQVLPLSMVDPNAEPDDLRPVEADTSDEAARTLGITDFRSQSKRD